MSNSIEDLDKRIDHKMEQRMNSRNTEWYYITGTEVVKGKSKGFLIGPFSYEKAEGLMKSRRFVSAEMVALPTTDLSRAGSILRYRRLHGGESMGTVMSRLKHKNVGQDMQDTTL